MRLERMNSYQSQLLTALTNDNARLKLELGHNKEMVEAQQRLLDQLQGKGATPAVDFGPGTGLRMTPLGPSIVMDADVFFAPGSATLKADGEKALKKVAEFLQQQPNMLAVNGFTDSDPILRSAWKSNFELSGARALQVLEYLKKQGIAPERMHFAGFGEYSLVTDASGKEDKKKSRRAEIVLLNEGALDVVPAVAPVENVTPK
jgi:chemotaxis protein MotB